MKTRFEKVHYGLLTIGVVCGMLWKDKVQALFSVMMGWLTSLSLGEIAGGVVSIAISVSVIYKNYQQAELARTQRNIEKN